MPVNQSCSHQSTSDRLPLLSRYYLSSAPATGGDNLEALLSTAGIVNLTQVRSDISSQLITASASLHALSPSLSSTQQAAFSSTLAALDAAISQLNSSIGWESPSPGSGLLSALGYKPMHSLYVSVKAQVCCTLSDQVRSIVMSSLLVVICHIARKMCQLMTVRLNCLPLDLLNHTLLDDKHKHK